MYVATSRHLRTSFGGNSHRAIQIGTVDTIALLVVVVAERAVLVALWRGFALGPLALDVLHDQLPSDGFQFQFKPVKMLGESVELAIFCNLHLSPILLQLLTEKVNR